MLQGNKLTLNTAKTYGLSNMVFHRARIKCKTEKFIIRNNEIAVIESTNFLGVIIDEKKEERASIVHIKINFKIYWNYLYNEAIFGQSHS